MAVSVMYRPGYFNIEDFTNALTRILDNQVKVFGTKYVKGSIIVADLHYGNHIFGEIIHVLVGDGTALLSDCNIVKVREFCF